MIHSAIQSKQAILVRIETSETGKLINQTLDPISHSFPLIRLCYRITRRLEIFYFFNLIALLISEKTFFINILLLYTHTPSFHNHNREG